MTEVLILVGVFFVCYLMISGHAVLGAVIAIGSVIVMSALAQSGKKKDSK